MVFERHEMTLSLLETLRRQGPLVLPSMLMCDFTNLEREVATLEAAGIAGLHLDVMDGQFVPNFTYGMTLVQAFRGVTTLPLDVHLMIANPLQYISAFADAGADVITFHAEAVEDPQPVIERIHAAGLPAGIAINASTPVERIADCLADCQLALVMGIEAGFGGQPFQPETLDKLSQIRELAGEQIVLEIDGGINRDTIALAANAGAELLVVGSAIFKEPSYATAVTELNRRLSNRHALGRGAG